MLMSSKLLYDSRVLEERRIAEYIKSLENNFNFIDLSKKEVAFTKLSKADSFFILVSEGNNNSETKSFLGYALDEVKRKAAGIISYSKDSKYQVKNVDEFKLFLVDLEIFPIKEKIRLIVEGRGIAENGDIKKMIRELSWWGKALRGERTKKN